MITWLENDMSTDENIGRDGIRYLGDMQRLSLAPNDLLVLTTDERLTDKAAQQIKKHLEGCFDAGQKILVLGGGMRLGVVQAPKDGE